MAGFVISGRLLFVFAHHHAAAFRAHQNLVLSLFKVDHFNDLGVASGGKKRRFINQVRQIRAAHAGRAASDNFRINVATHRHFLHMNIENLFTSAHIRQRHHHLAVKAARTQKRGIQNIGTVRGGNHDHVRAGFKTIHFDEHLV